MDTRQDREMGAAMAVHHAPREILRRPESLPPEFQNPMRYHDTPIHYSEFCILYFPYPPSNFHTLPPFLDLTGTLN